MDRNQIIGLILIGAIVIGFMLLTQPSQTEIEAARKRRDSIAQVQHEQLIKQQQADEQRKLEAQKEDSIQKTESNQPDSIKAKNLQSIYGSFADAAIGENKFITLENDLMRIKISNLGGRIYSVELKNYKTYDSLPLILFDGSKNTFGLEVFAQNKAVLTNNFYFKPQVTDTVLNATKNMRTLAMRMSAGEDKYIEYFYTIEPGSYLIGFEIRFHNLGEILTQNSQFIDLRWENYVPGLERINDWENNNTSLYYKHKSGDVEKLTPTSDNDDEQSSAPVKWIAYKQQFFSSILIAHKSMESVHVKQSSMAGKDSIMKFMASKITLAYDKNKQEPHKFSFYFGPNKYKTLKNLTVTENDDLQLSKLLPLGWGIFGWFNKWAIIPLFNFLGSFFGNYGLIILLMTIIIKLVLFPLTYKSYLSTARMRVLKPQIEEIQNKIPKEKAMERQQATMALYKKAGVNPLGGCLPVLLQLPILIAMFNFFPASIELRQESFLWANDLSSYDAIVSWTAHIPIISSWYGNHISLFTILMAAAMVVSTLMTSNQMDTSGQMPGMKMMMWLMPVMMVFWFNNYSAGLSYYYFLSNVITIGQTLIIRRFVDEKSLLEKLNANVKKNKTVQKSKFQQRLEDMAKKRGMQLPK